MLNAQYSRRGIIKVTGMPLSIRNTDLEDKVHNIFGEIDVNVYECGIQSCHRLREIVKFVNRKDSMNIQRVRKVLKHLDPSKLSFSKGIKIIISENLCLYYRGISNKFKKLRANKNWISFLILMGLFALN